MEEELSGQPALHIDQTVKSHLQQTARWTNFIAIVSIVMVALAAVGFSYSA